MEYSGRIRPPAFLLAVLSALSAVSALPAVAQEASWQATVGANGTVTVRRKAGDAPVLTIAPGIFERTWQFRGIGPGDGFDATTTPVTAQGTVFASAAEARIPVRTTVTAEGKTLTLRSSFASPKPVAVNSVHLSVSLDTNRYVNAAWAAGGRTGTVPAVAGEAGLVRGEKEIVLADGPERLVFRSPEPSLLLQDNRAYGSPILEVRAGGQEERTLQPGANETVELTIEFPQTLAVVRDEPLTVRQGEDWVPLDLKLDIKKGSALDFGRLFPRKPAGDSGWVIVRPDGHFGFEKSDRPVRFYGTNLCFSANYLEPAEADRLADRFVALGYNTVRIHHYEGDLIEPNRPDSLTFRREQLDRFDYLMAAFKKRGIHISTDLYVSRPVKPEEMEGLGDFKAAVLVSAKARANWKEFTRRLLTHVNPYTGLAYRDDPAMAFLCVVNEPNATNYFGGMNERLRERFVSEWTRWRIRTGRPDAPLPGSTNDGATGREAAAFLSYLHTRAYTEMAAFLKQEIGTRAVLTDLNGWSEIPGFMTARLPLDYVDNHFYWDHPQFLARDWSLPSQGYQRGQSAVRDGGTGPSNVAMTRLFGKPFTVSEFNYTAPNPYRAEGGLLMGAAAALQDWDIVWRFAYSHSRDAVIRPVPLDYFNTASDPISAASDRAAVLLFRRGDLRPAKSAVVRTLNGKALAEGGEVTAPDFRDLTLVTRIGNRVLFPAGLSPNVNETEELRLSGGDAAQALLSLKQSGKLPQDNRTDLGRRRLESETGELLNDGSTGLLRIVTPRTVGGVAPVGETLTAGPLTVVPSGATATVWVSSLDGRAVRDSRRLLLTHLTDVRNEGMRFSSSDALVLENWGTLPHLARQGTVAVRLIAPGRWKAWRLDTAGNRVATVPVVRTGETVTVELSTRGPDGKATLYYELVR
ncbi:MAG: hypothetical protein SFU56_12645 [Capsulimonadales bacterium]|nr:hypothetical protein [Capsulimonadales bacterium]